MTEVMTTCESVGGASGEEALALQVFPDPAEDFPKLSRLLPSIVVEPTDGGDVESGELRWPPDDVSSDVREDQAQVAGPMEEAEPQEEGGV
ncbi:protein LBH [Sparus aurata]|uniref:protein LBH n=1 Tax=Sparus aurata TaxID=8175 RepID=UPI0011C1329E|nr:protein LBH-like [Sparus aurata]